MRVAPLAGGAALVAAAWGVACHAKPESAARRYPLHGTVLAVNRSRGHVVVQHDDIPGYMAAMTMPFAVGNARDLDGLDNGDEIRADVVATVEGAVHLEHITVLRHAKVSSSRP